MRGELLVIFQLHPRNRKAMIDSPQYADLTWLDQSTFNEQKDTEKKSSRNLKHVSFSHSTSYNSQRFNYIISKTSLLALPMSKKADYARKKANHGKLFPKKGKVKHIEHFNEPSSPQVSCMGRVRSRRDRLRNRQSSSHSTDRDKSNRKNGILESVRAVFRGKRMEKPKKKEGLSWMKETAATVDRFPAIERDLSARRSWDGVKSNPELMQRFLSRRRSVDSLALNILSVPQD